MSINVIIIAILAIAVIVVLFAVFTGRIGLIGKQIDSCSNVGGTCTTGNVCAEKSTRYYTPNKMSDCEENQICCISITI